MKECGIIASQIFCLWFALNVPTHNYTSISKGCKSSITNYTPLTESGDINWWYQKTWTMKVGNQHGRTMRPFFGLYYELIMRSLGILKISRPTCSLRKNTFENVPRT